jgi:hypothetical protein
MFRLFVLTVVLGYLWPSPLNITPDNWELPVYSLNQRKIKMISFCALF